MSNDRIATIVATVVTFVAMIGLGALGRWIFDEHGFGWGAAFSVGLGITGLGGAALLDKRREHLPWSDLWRAYRRDLGSLFRRQRNR